MQENTVVQETTSANQGQISGQNVVRVVEKTETAETKRMKEHFNFFGPVTFLYAVFYAFCMFHNGSGITFPFFLAGTLLYFVFSLSKLGITLKKGSAFYMVSILLLGVSTFCTDGWAIISLNKLAVFLLVMCLLLNQYFDTTKWKLGKYVGSICQLVVMSFGELGKPFSDGKAYFREKGKVNKKVWYGLLGVVIALPIVLIAAGLLSSADAVFRKMTTDFMNWIRPGNIFNVVIRVTFLFFTSYALTSYLCKRSIPEEVKDRRKGEPVLAITIMSLLSLLYLLFSGIQINRLNASVPDIPGSIIKPADCQSISVRRNCDGSYMIHCIHSQSDLFHAVLVQVIPIHINSIQRLAAKYKHSIMKCPDRSFQHVVLFF